MANQEQNCYLGINGQQHGPMSESDVQKMYDNGEITGDTKFIQAGMAGWINLSEAGIFIPPLPPLPPLPEEPLNRAPLRQAPTQSPSHPSAHAVAPVALGNLMLTGEKNTSKALLFTIIYFAFQAILSIAMANLLGANSFLFYLFMLIAFAELACLGLNIHNISNSGISVFESGIQGNATNRAYYVQNIKTMQFSLPYDQIESAVAKNEQLTISSQGVKYYIYTKNASEIQSIITEKTSNDGQ